MPSPTISRNGKGPAPPPARAASVVPVGDHRPALADPFPNRRDERGNRLPTRGVSHTPISIGPRLEGPEWDALIALVAEVSPANAAYLNGFYNRCLIPSIDTYRQVCQ